MSGRDDGDMTGRDPLSSTAEGSPDPGSAALAGAGTGHAEEAPASEQQTEQTGQTEGSEEGDARGDGPIGPPPEAFDDTPVTDAPPVSGPDA